MQREIVSSWLGAVLNIRTTKKPAFPRQQSTIDGEITEIRVITLRELLVLGFLARKQHIWMSRSGRRGKKAEPKRPANNDNNKRRQGDNETQQNPRQHSMAAIRKATVIVGQESYIGKVSRARQECNENIPQRRHSERSVNKAMVNIESYCLYQQIAYALCNEIYGPDKKKNMDWK